MKSALFVDFDNVFTQLRQLQPETAERFARCPSDWIRWLVDSLPLHEGQDNGQRRRLLVRRCYLNPAWYQNYRHAFLRAGFEIVDCPPVTSQGKTSTDIHMVLDIVELLQHATHYDEFIVFSADADFTPVLRKLRRYDRRTTVLAIGFPSAAYQASADLLIDERSFIENALGFGGQTAAGTGVEPGTPSMTTATPPDGANPGAATAASSDLGAVERTAEPGPAAVARQATAAELATIAERILNAVDRAPQAVAAATLAARIKQEFPQVTENWNGCGTFKQFFLSLGLPRLAWSSGAGGRIYDPLRQTVDATAPAPDAGSRWSGESETYAVAREVCALTGAPLLAPADLRAVVGVLGEDLAQHPFELAATARRVCERCLESHQLSVSPRDISFLLRGMQLNGHVFGAGHDDARTLARRLVDQVLFLCQREQMVLDEAATERIRYWIGGEPLA